MATKPQQGGSNGEGLRQRVNRCLTMLSDRDTEAMAASELDAIARSLTAAAFPPFLSAIADARPTDKTPLRRHSLRLLSLLSHAHPAAAVAPHLPRMLAAALRRLRDPDSSVRAAYVDAVRSMAAAQPTAVAAALLRPLADALIHEQDQCAQAAAALSLAAAVDASGGRDPDLAPQLQRLLPRLVKLLKSNAFKAKPALLSLLGSAAGAGGAGTPALVALLVPCLVESLASDDWATRKAGAEALSVLAIAEKDLLPDFRSPCLSSFESRRFDKVKIVRDSMNRMLDVWKDVPEATDSESNVMPASKSQTNAATKGSDGRYPAASVNPSSAKSPSPFAPGKNKMSRSPPPAASPIPAARRNAPSIRKKILSPPSYRKADQKASDWRVEVAVAGAPAKTVSEEKIQNSREQGRKEGGTRCRSEAPSGKSYDEHDYKLAGRKLDLHVAQFQESDGLESGKESSIAPNESNSGNRDGDLSSIKLQLVQIEKQQSNLLDLLQRFIGSSQNGIHSLETRVNGLEMALNDISRDIALSSERMYSDSAATCCRLPGAEFLSSKLWRRSGRRYSGFSMSLSESQTEKESRGSRKWENQRSRIHGGFILNPLAELNPQAKGTGDLASNKMLRNVLHDRGVTNA